MTDTKTARRVKSRDVITWSLRLYTLCTQLAVFFFYYYYSIRRLQSPSGSRCRRTPDGTVTWRKPVGQRAIKIALNDLRTETYSALGSSRPILTGQIFAARCRLSDDQFTSELTDELMQQGGLQRRPTGARQGTAHAQWTFEPNERRQCVSLTLLLDLWSTCLLKYSKVLCSYKCLIRAHFARTAR